jgi:chromosomal replication initiator protein
MSIETTLIPEKAWSDILEIVKPLISLQNFNTWLKSTSGIFLNEEIIQVSVPNKFAADWIRAKFQRMLTDAITTNLGSPRMIDYICQGDKDAPANSRVSIPNRKPLPSHRLCAMTQLNSAYTFDYFVVGDSNQLAHAAALAVAREPLETKYNPLFIYGGVGLGKTHLVQAIGNYVRDAFSDLKILYVTSEKFTSDFIEAISHQKTMEFARQYRSVDLLLLDDIQFLTGKEATQEQFFHTFNALHQAGKQVVLTSDRSPREIKGLEERLLSRFQCGLVTDIQPPDLETRIAILQQIVIAEKRSVSFDVISFMARNITRNIRELQGSIIRLLAFASMREREIDIDFTQEVLKDAFTTGHPITMDSITRAVCEYFKIELHQIKSKRKTADLVRARQVAMYLCRKHTSSSLNSIGEEYGGRDHSTVIHALNTIAEDSQRDNNLKNIIVNIEARLKS